MGTRRWWSLPGFFAAAIALALAVGVVPPSAAAGSGSQASAKPSKAARSSKSTKPQRATKRSKRKVAARTRPSYGKLYGLHEVEDDLELKSSVALVVDQDSNEILFSKNPSVVLPIASITKLMTALVVTEAELPLDEVLEVSRDDVRATAASGQRSRLRQGTRLTRGDMLHLALMSSENRAAHVLGRSYPGGLEPFVQAMNDKAKALGMHGTKYVEPTGLSSDNQSSAQDLALLVRAASEHPIIRELSTSPSAAVPVGRRSLQFNNTNGLVRNPEWDIGLQKTGYITAAGRCLVMQTQLAGRKLIMVLLDSAGKYSRIGDAERIRKWLAAAALLPRATVRLPDLPELPKLATLPATAGLAGSLDYP